MNKTCSTCGKEFTIENWEYFKYRCDACDQYFCPDHMGEERYCPKCEKEISEKGGIINSCGVIVGSENFIIYEKSYVKIKINWTNLGGRFRYGLWFDGYQCGSGGGIHSKDPGYETFEEMKKAAHADAIERADNADRNPGHANNNHGQIARELIANSFQQMFEF